MSSLPIKHDQNVSPGKEAALTWPDKVKVQHSGCPSWLLQLSYKRAQCTDKFNYSWNILKNCMSFRVQSQMRMLILLRSVLILLIPTAPFFGMFLQSRFSFCSPTTEGNKAVALKTPEQKKEMQQAPGLYCGFLHTWSFGAVGSARQYRQLPSVM